MPVGVARIRPVRSTLTTWFLLFGLLLQSVAWALPAQQAGQAEQLAHEWAHAIDHGHHPHDADAAHKYSLSRLLGQLYSANGSWDHDRDAALDLGDHGPHHIHASEAGQVQGLPVPPQRPVLHLPHAPPGALTLLPPSSADPDSLLRPPQARV